MNNPITECLTRIRALLHHDGDTTWQLSDTDLLEEITELETLTRLATAAGLERIGELDRRTIATTHGYRTTHALLIDHLHLHPGEARDRVTIAEATTGTQPELPATAAALRQGELTLTHAHVITTTLRSRHSPGTTTQTITDCEAQMVSVSKVADPAGSSATSPPKSGHDWTPTAPSRTKTAKPRAGNYTDPATGTAQASSKADWTPRVKRCWRKSSMPTANPPPPKTAPWTRAPPPSGTTTR
jgi:Domain of unknown function (DUF222)